jgi:hypothetical protein
MRLTTIAAVSATAATTTRIVTGRRSATRIGQIV